MSNLFQSKRHKWTKAGYDDVLKPFVNVFLTLVSPVDDFERATLHQFRPRHVLVNQSEEVLMNAVDYMIVDLTDYDLHNKTDVPGTESHINVEDFGLANQGLVQTAVNAQGQEQRYEYNGRSYPLYKFVGTNTFDSASPKTAVKVENSLLFGVQDASTPIPDFQSALTHLNNSVDLVAMRENESNNYVFFKKPVSFIVSQESTQASWVKQADTYNMPVSYDTSQKAIRLKITSSFAQPIFPTETEFVQVADADYKAIGVFLMAKDSFVYVMQNHENCVTQTGDIVPFSSSQTIFQIIFQDNTYNVQDVTEIALTEIAANFADLGRGDNFASVYSRRSVNNKGDDDQNVLRDYLYETDLHQDGSYGDEKACLYPNVLKKAVMSEEDGAAHCPLLPFVRMHISHHLMIFYSLRDEIGEVWNSAGHDGKKLHLTAHAGAKSFHAPDMYHRSKALMRTSNFKKDELTNAINEMNQSYVELFEATQDLNPHHKFENFEGKHYEYHNSHSQGHCEDIGPEDTQIEIAALSGKCESDGLPCGAEPLCEDGSLCVRPLRVSDNQPFTPTHTQKLKNACEMMLGCEWVNLDQVSVVGSNYPINGICADNQPADVDGNCADGSEPRLPGPQDDTNSSTLDNHACVPIDCHRHQSKEDCEDSNLSVEDLFTESRYQSHRQRFCEWVDTGNSEEGYCTLRQVDGITVKFWFDVTEASDRFTMLLRAPEYETDGFVETDGDSDSLQQALKIVSINTASSCSYDMKYCATIKSSDTRTCYSPASACRTYLGLEADTASCSAQCPNSVTGVDYYHPKLKLFMLPIYNIVLIFVFVVAVVSTVLAKKTQMLLVWLVVFVSLIFLGYFTAPLPGCYQESEHKGFTQLGALDVSALCGCDVCGGDRNLTGDTCSTCNANACAPAALHTSLYHKHTSLNCEHARDWPLSDKSGSVFVALDAVSYESGNRAADINNGIQVQLMVDYQDYYL